MAEGALSANAYLDHVLTALGQGAERMLEEHVVFYPGDRTGRVRATFAYPGGFLLHAAVTVECGRHGPQWTAYGFQVIGPDGRSMIRCDNSRRHPEVATFPHHQHVGPAEAVQPAERPTLRRVVQDVARVVTPATGDAGTHGP